MQTGGIVKTPEIPEAMPHPPPAKLKGWACQHPNNSILGGGLAGDYTDIAFLFADFVLCHWG
jgi:hypothetical protein